MPTTSDRTRPPQSLILLGSQAQARAQRWVQRLFCQRACGSCSHCLKLAHGSHPDAHWVRAEGKNVRLEQVRALQKRASFPPLEAGYQVFVIERAERLSREAANALLKTLEDPPPHAIFVLLTPRLGDLLPTVVSRCRTVREADRRPDEPALERACWGQPAWLEVFSPGPSEGGRSETTPAALAKTLSEAPALQDMAQAVEALWQALPGWTVAQVLELTAALSKVAGPRLEYTLQGLNVLAHQRLPAAPPQLAAQRALSLSYGKLRGNANVQLLLESLLLQLWRLHHEGAQSPAGLHAPPGERYSAARHP